MTAGEYLRKVARDRMPDRCARRAAFFHSHGDIALCEVVTALPSHPGARARWSGSAGAVRREEVLP